MRKSIGRDLLPEEIRSEVSGLFSRAARLLDTTKPERVVVIIDRRQGGTKIYAAMGRIA